MKLLFPGTFDPFTKGHEHLVERALAFSSEIIIAIGESSKKELCSAQDRLELIQTLYEKESRVSAITFQGLLADTAKRLKVTTIIRGVRHAGDLQYEMPMAIMNRQLNPHLETLFLCTLPEYMHISSTMMREILARGGDIRPFVSSVVAEYYKQNLNLEY